MKWGWVWPWSRRRNGAAAQAQRRAEETLVEQRRKLRETERLGDDLRRAARSVEQRLSTDFLADVEAAWARRHR